jgi:hypothetical protein
MRQKIYHIMAIGWLLLLPAISFAAYQNPTVVTNDRQPNGTVLLTFAFTGNAGEPTVTRGYVVSSGTTVALVRSWIDDTIKELDLVRAAETLGAVQPGQTVTRLAKVTPAKAAKQAWNEDFALYLRIKDSGITALSSVIATVKARVEANWQAGYLDE